MYVLSSVSHAFSCCVIINLLCYLCPHAATLLIKGPTEPVVEGDTVTLECLLSDSEYNISQVHFEIFSTVS